MHFYVSVIYYLAIRKKFKSSASFKTYFSMESILITVLYEFSFSSEHWVIICKNQLGIDLRYCISGYPEV